MAHLRRMRIEAFRSISNIMHKPGYLKLTVKKLKITSYVLPTSVGAFVRVRMGDDVYSTTANYGNMKKMKWEDQYFLFKLESEKIIRFEVLMKAQGGPAGSDYGDYFGHCDVIVSKIFLENDLSKIKLDLCRSGSKVATVCFAVDVLLDKALYDSFKKLEATKQGMSVGGGYNPAGFAIPTTTVAVTPVMPMNFSAGGFAPNAFAPSAGGFAPNAFAPSAGGFAPNAFAPSAGEFAPNAFAPSAGGFAPNAFAPSAGGVAPNAFAPSAPPTPIMPTSYAPPPIPMFTEQPQHSAYPPAGGGFTVRSTYSAMPGSVPQVTVVPSPTPMMIASPGGYPPGGHYGLSPKFYGLKKDKKKKNKWAF